MRRRGWKSGDWLVRDEESGLVEYGSNVIRDYYGVLKRKDQAEKAHPQLFVRAKSDPYMQYPQANPSYTYDTSAYDVSAFIGATNIRTPIGPASHLFAYYYAVSADQGGGGVQGIGDMAIGSSFIVS